MISDIYIVEYLFQHTNSGKIIWHKSERNSSLFFASLNEGIENRIDLIISIVQGRVSIPQVYLKLLSLKLKQSGKFNQVDIIESSPRLFRRSYETQDEQDLAELLKKLYRVVVDQCTDRKLSGMKNEDQIRQEIYKQVLNFKNPE